MRILQGFRLVVRQWPEVSDFVTHCARQKTHGHAKRVRFSHGRGFSTRSSCKKCDTNHIPQTCIGAAASGGAFQLRRCLGRPARMPTMLRVRLGGQLGRPARGPPGLERRKTTADLNPKQRLMPWTGPRPSCRDPRSAPGPGLGNFFIF